MAVACRWAYNAGMMALFPTSSSDRRTGRGLFELTLEGLVETITGWGEPPFRAAQILEWAYRHGASAYEEMSNLPKRLRGQLAAEGPIYSSTILRRQEAKDGTIKLLLRWADGAASECVLIPDDNRRTACVSTQVGCPVGCVFCASGLDGLERQLSRGEIVEQVMRLRQLSAAPPRLSNVVFMGLGEPLANYDATVGAVRTINAEWGLGIGARKITVSTVGLPAQMRRLADEGLQVTVALSLHAPTDDLRRRIIPSADRVSVAALVEACNYYFERTGREVTLEYILLAGLNDAPEHARALARVARSMRSNVNLIAYNPVPDLPYQRPSVEEIRQFLTTLRRAGINAHLRRSRGRDVNAACGQLRRRQC